MKTILKSIIFILILLMLILGVRNVLAIPTSYINEKTGINDIHKYPQSYDVCFIGRSTMVSNVSCQELYEQYGIAGVSAGVSRQSFPMTLYTLEEVLEYQSPKVVFLDTRIFFEPIRAEIQNYQDEAYLHFSLDDIKTYSIKKKAIDKAKLYNDEIDEWDFYSKLYYSHGNWKDISQKNFTNYDDDALDTMHGNAAYLDIAYNVNNTYAESPLNNAAIITMKTEKYISEMIDLCNENGAELIFLTNYVQATKSQHRAILRLANRYDLKYIDINEFLLKSGFRHDMDLYDTVHFNLSGAIKATNFLGAFLQENYDFSDKRKNTSYVRYEEQKELFQSQKDFIYSKQSLLSAVTFHKYLKELKNIDYNKNVLFITVYGDAISKLTLKEYESLKELGLKTNLLGKNGGSYAAVISENHIQEEFAFLNTVVFENNIDMLEYEIKSGGSKSGERSSIIINEKEYFPGGKGFNFVLYNTEFETVISSCFFDTSVSVNPVQSRYKATPATNLQQETGPNKWETVE